MWAAPREDHNRLFIALMTALITLAWLSLWLWGQSPSHSSSIRGCSILLSSAVWLIVLSRRLAGDPRWRGLATYSLASGIMIAVLFVANGVLVIPDDAPLHPYAGLAQRAVLAVLFPCMIVFALRVLKVTKEADAP